MAPVAPGTLPAAMAEPLIRGDGTAEPLWLSWLARADLPCLPLEHWLPLSARLVVVAPHPDDEVLGCGALLASHSARGGECLLLYVSDGEASHPSTRQRSTAQLAATRRQESLDGCALLGLPQPDIVRLGLPDGRIERHRDKLLRALGALLHSADVVVATWRKDGHPDHDVVGHCAAAACASAGVQLIEAPVWMWHWASPGDPRVPWKRLRGLAVDPAISRQKVSALNAHLSQLEAEAGPPVLGAAIRTRAGRSVEYFFV